jgi:arylsulfatase A-like enzyme
MIHLEQVRSLDRVAGLLGRLIRFLLLSAFASAAPLRAAPPRPNIIFVLVDDLGYGDVGVFFQNLRQTQNNRAEPWHFTPKLDTLATEGVQLPHHYCPAPVCAPSRASLLLGVHQGHANVRDNQFDKELENNHTVASVLRRAGYATACIGKWGLQGSGTGPNWPAHPLNRGFDYYYGYIRHGDGHEHYPKEGLYRGVKEVWENRTEVSAGLDKCYTADLFAARTKQWIIDHQSTNAAQPFFVYLAFDTPHAVLELPTQAYPAGGGTNGGLQWLGTPGQMINTASGTIDSYYHPDYTTATYDHDRNPGTAEVAWPDVYKRYATDVRRIDDCLGDLIQLLKDLGSDDNTLVVFTTDNGPSQESYLAEAYNPDFFNSFGPFDGIKRDLWEGGIRVGALARWPGGIPANRVNTVPSGFWDWMPTFAELAGMPSPARSDGRSLVPSLTGVGAQVPPTVYIEYYQNGTTPSYSDFAPVHRGRRRNQMQAVRMGNHIGVRYNIASHADDFEIYNVLVDPQQTNNLAGIPANAELQQQMKERVLRVRRPNSSAARPYDSELVPAVAASPVTPGVEWQSFEGAFSWVPELTSLTASASGVTNQPTLNVRPRDNDIGLWFTGYLSVPADGDYTFSLAADTGALLRIHEATVLDADFGYTAGAEVTGSIKLKAGLHPFRLYYVRGTNGTPSLDLQWSGPGFTTQPIPASAFRRDGAAPPGPPTARDDSASTTQGTAVWINVLANDEDDGAPQPLSVQSVTTPTGGTATIVSNQVLYTPNANFLGTDTFNYTMTDGGTSATTRVTVEVLFEDPDLLWLPLNQFSGLRAFESGGQAVGTLGGFSDPANPWVEGRFNRAVQFNGTDQKITLDSTYLPPSGASARTITAWVKATPGTSGAIVAWGPNTNTKKWHFRLESATANTGALRVEVTGGYIIGTRDLRDGQWHHVACTFTNDGSPNVTDVKLYVDGTPETISTSQSQTVDTDGTSLPVTIGVDSQNRYFNGVIDEVRIYRRALSPAEIAAVAAATQESAAAWNRRFFGNAPSVWEADDDDDFADRLMEYALGGQPHIPDAEVIKPRPEIVGDHFQIRFLRRLAGSHELTYTVQASPDLADWTTLSVSEVSATPVATPDGFEEVTVRADSPVSTVTPVFIRLRVGFE